MPKAWSVRMSKGRGLTALRPMATFSLAMVVSCFSFVFVFGHFMMTSGRVHASQGASRGDFRVAVLQHGGAGHGPRGEATRRMVWEVLKRTSISANMEPLAVRASGKELYQSPFLLIMGDREYPDFSEREILNLRRYLELGGFIMADSLGGGPNGAFDRWFRRNIERVFPRNQLFTLPTSHVIYKSFYLLERPFGRTMTSPVMEGIELDGRIAVVLTHNDLPGAWARDPLGLWVYDVIPGGEHQRERAFRMGVNLVMYAMCTDYKDDQVHVPFILKKRRWRTRMGED